MKWPGLIFLVACAGGHVAAQGRFEGYTAGQSRADNGAKMAYHLCPPGQYVMGRPESEPGHDPYEKQHPVRLTKGFWLGESEVTQEHWTAVTGKTLRQQAQLMLADDKLYPHGGKQMTLRETFGDTEVHDLSKVCAATA